jgi:hypothetical protein
MIELTYAHMKQNPAFGSALLKLKRCETFGPKVAYTMGKLLKKIESEWKTADELQVKIWDKYCKKENGRFVEEGGRLALKEDADTVAFEKEMKEFWSIGFTIEWNKLTLDDLEGVKNPGLTPDEISALEPMIHHLEVVKL